MKMEGFSVTDKDGLRLIVPEHGTVGLANGIWNRENTWLRSRVEDLDGNIASQGWGKFWNLGLGPDGLRIELDDVLKAIESRDAVATLKYDGSALYFSSHNGKRIIRTRGSHGYEHLENGHEITALKEKYPIMFDPSYMEGFTLLCEFCTPTQQIVIKYPEPLLVLIGGVNHKTMKYLTINELSHVSAMTGVKLVDNFPLSRKGWDALYTELDKNQDIEGYVIRLNKEQDLVKIKCLPYLTKHSLKSNLTSDKLADLFFQYGQPNYLDFCKKFTDAFDEEICMWAQGAISNLFEGVKHYNKIMEHLRAKVESRKHYSRKEFAIEAQQEYGATKKFSVAMSLYLGTEPKQDVLKHILLGHTKQCEMGMFKKLTEVDDGE